MIHSLKHNNNENNLQTFSSNLVNQINQSIQQNNTPTCSIWLENLNNNNKRIRTISCGHIFHQNCIHHVHFKNNICYNILLELMLT